MNLKLKLNYDLDQIETHIFHLKGLLAEAAHKDPYIDGFYTEYVNAVQELNQIELKQRKEVKRLWIFCAGLICGAAVATFLISLGLF